MSARADLEIRGGGVVAVDTDTLRAAAGRFDAVRIELDEACRRAASVRASLGAEGAAEAEALAWSLSVRLGEVSADAERIARSLREAAAVYELVELRVQVRAAFAVRDFAEAGRIGRRRAELQAEYPDAAAAAEWAMFERTIMWPSEMVRQATELGLWTGDELGTKAAVYGGAALGSGAVALALAAGGLGFGRAERPLAGAPPAVTVTRTASVTPRTVHAPTSLADAASRIPTGGARVRVESYAMPDGSRQFAVYVAGTRTQDLGTDDPWDNRSNVELYTGTTSASFAATTEALADAGARPGDVVHAWGHSQGAMITSQLALAGDYDVRTNVTLGSPIDAATGPSTLSVGIRHTDDPIVSLAGGGHAMPAGAPGSFVVETSFNPETGLHDARNPAHPLSAYVETAGRVDAAADTRVAGVHRVLEELGAATDVTAVEYAARRG